LVTSPKHVYAIPNIVGEKPEVVVVESPRFKALSDMVEEIRVAQAVMVVQLALQSGEQGVCEALECFLSEAPPWR
jgi:hypothetical protein